MTSLTCSSIQDSIKDFSLVKDCDVIQNGTMRLATPFQYPEGSNIDMFLSNTNTLIPEWVLSDFGQTTAYLLNLHLKHWATKKRKQLVSDICASLGVELDGGQLQIKIQADRISELPQAIVRLSQACVRVSDLAFTQRLQAANAFGEDFEEFLEAADLKYDTNVVLIGQYEKKVEVDFLVYGRRMKSLVQTISTGNAAASHGMTTEVFRRWFDLMNHKSMHQFLTIYDSSNDVFRDDDIARLGEFSTVFAYPANDESIQQALVA